jgi:hypothetical protein
MTDYKVTPEQWADTEYYGNPNRKPCPNLESSCILELRARVQSLEDDSWKQAESTRFCVDVLVKRIEALEVNSKSTSNPSQIRSSLVERVARAIGQDDEPINWEPEARAAIREVAAWMTSNPDVYFPPALVFALEREAEL